MNSAQAAAVAAPTAAVNPFSVDSSPSAYGAVVVDNSAALKIGPFDVIQIEGAGQPAAEGFKLVTDLQKALNESPYVSSNGVNIVTPPRAEGNGFSFLLKVPLTKPISIQ